MFKPITKTAYKVILGLFMLSFIMVACNNKSEKKTEGTDTTKVEDTNTQDTKTMTDTTKTTDTSMKKKPTDEGDKPE